MRAPVFLRLRDDRDWTEISVTTDVRASEPLDELRLVDEQLEAARSRVTIELRNQRVAVTNLERELWPATTDQRAVTNRTLLQYFARISLHMLPHLRDRPLTLTRFPNGIDGKSFFQKHWKDKRPSFVDGVSIFSCETNGDYESLLANNLSTILWLGQLTDLVLHTSLARVERGPDGSKLSQRFGGSHENLRSSLLNYPDFLLFDLDPFVDGKGEYSAAGFALCSEVAVWLKELLDDAGLRAYVKTSGSSGIHVLSPIVRNLRYAAVRGVCQTFASALLAAHPRAVTLDSEKENRRGKVFVDVSQNGLGRSLAAVYSPRAHPGAPVSMPLRWGEIGAVDPQEFGVVGTRAR